MPAKTKTKTRTNYPAETKRQAVLALLNRGNTSVEEIAGRFGASSSLIYRWRDAGWGAKPTVTAMIVPVPPDTPPHGNGLNGHAVDRPLVELTEDMADEHERLRAEIERLRAENAELRTLLKRLL